MSNNTWGSSNSFAPTLASNADKLKAIIVLRGYDNYPSHIFTILDKNGYTVAQHERFLKGNIIFATFLADYDIDSELGAILSDDPFLNHPNNRFSKSTLGNTKYAEALKHVTGLDVRHTMFMHPSWSVEEAVVVSHFPEMEERYERINKSGIKANKKVWNFRDQVISRSLFESNEDIETILQVATIPGMKLHNIKNNLTQGYTEFEMKNYGPHAVIIFTPEQLSKVTVKAVHFKNICSLFKSPITSRKMKDFPTADRIEEIVKAGYTTASEYRKMAKLFGYIDSDASWIDEMIEVRKIMDPKTAEEVFELFDKIKPVNMVQSKPTLHDLREISLLLDAGHSIDNYKQLMCLADESVEEEFSKKISKTASVAIMMDYSMSETEVADLVQQGKSFAEIANQKESLF